MPVGSEILAYLDTSIYIPPLDSEERQKRRLLGSRASAALCRIRRQPLTEYSTAPSDSRGAESRSRQMAPSTGHRAPLPTPGKQPSSKPPTIIGVSHHTLRSPSLGAPELTSVHTQEYEIICQSNPSLDPPPRAAEGAIVLCSLPTKCPPVHGPRHRVQKRPRLGRPSASKDTRELTILWSSPPQLHSGLARLERSNVRPPPPAL